MSHLFSAGALTDTFSSEGWKTSMSHVCKCTASQYWVKAGELPFALKKTVSVNIFVKQQYVRCFEKTSELTRLSLGKSCSILKNEVGWIHSFAFGMVQISKSEFKRTRVK